MSRTSRSLMGLPSRSIIVLSSCAEMRPSPSRSKMPNASRWSAITSRALQLSSRDLPAKEEDLPRHASEGWHA
eukprot:scaffold15405_cov119-Isochrysis_galbana.AAC.6